MVRAILYNILYLEGKTGVWWDYLKLWQIVFPPKGLDKRIAKYLKRLNPDIVAFVEIDTGSFRARKDEVRFFEHALGMKSFVEKIKYPKQGWLRLFHMMPLLKNQANAIIAKNQLYGTKVRLFHEGTKRVVIQTSVNVPEKVTFLLVHLALIRKNVRSRQIHELIRIVNSIEGPVILMGDFNTFGGEKEVEDLLKKTKLENKYEMDTESMRSTQPTYRPTRHLDYIFTSGDVSVKKYQVLNFHFSDHLPVLIDFKIGKKKSSKKKKKTTKKQIIKKKIKKPKS